MIHPLRLTRDTMTWNGTPHAVTDIQHPAPNCVSFTATCDGLWASHVEIDVPARAFRVDGILHELRGWHSVGKGVAEGETVDPPGPTWMEAEEEVRGRDAHC